MNNTPTNQTDPNGMLSEGQMRLVVQQVKELMASPSWSQHPDAAQILETLPPGIPDVENVVATRLLDVFAARLEENLARRGGPRPATIVQKDIPSMAEIVAREQAHAKAFAKMQENRFWKVVAYGAMATQTISITAAPWTASMWASLHAASGKYDRAGVALLEGAFVKGAYIVAGKVAGFTGRLLGRVAPRLTGFTTQQQAMINRSLTALREAGYDVSLFEELIFANIPEGVGRAMSLTTRPTGAALSNRAFSSQAMLNHVLEEEVLHIMQSQAGRTGVFLRGTAQRLEREVHATRVFPEPRN